MRDISNYQSDQALTSWSGDVPSLLAEMKRRAGVRTDQELARFMGAAQSTVSNWRKRGAIPEAAVLQFEKAAADPEGSRFSRNLSARVIAMRLPELWYKRYLERGSTAGRYIPYAAIAYCLNGIVDEISRQMEILERDNKISTDALAAILLEDEKFLGGVIDWVSSTPMAEMLVREKAAVQRSPMP